MSTQDDDNDPDENLLLKNLIARSAILLHRATKALGTGTPEQREAIIIDSEEWFQETRRQLAEAINKPSRIALPEKRFIPPPAPPKVIDVGWKMPPPKDFEPSEPGALDYFLK